MGNCVFSDIAISDAVHHLKKKEPPASLGKEFVEKGDALRTQLSRFVLGEIDADELEAAVRDTGLDSKAEAERMLPSSPTRTSSSAASSRRQSTFSQASSISSASKVVEKEKPRFDPDIDTYPDETMRIMKRMAKISAASAIDLRREPSYRKLREQESPLSVLDDADGRSPLNTSASSESFSPAVLRLHESSCDGDLSHVSALVNGGADVNLRDKYGNTALIRAAGSGKLKMVELLLASGAQVNARNGDGNTALHFSAFRGHTLVCQALLEHLAVPTIENRAGQRAWDCAVKRGHFLLCAMLEEEQHRRRQREPRLIFLIASRQKHNPIARSLTGNLLFDASAVRIIFGLAGFIPPVEPCAR